MTTSSAAGDARVRATDPAGLAMAAALLRQGRIVAIPTETVYGLAADARQDAAIAEVYRVKGRPATHPLIVHVDGWAAIEGDVVVTPMARVATEALWPGPLTVVLQRRPGGTIAASASGGRDSLAVRAPDLPATRALLRFVGAPLVAPSANRFGQVSPTTAAHVAEAFGAELPLILDGGPCAVGVESTVVDLRGSAPLLLRPGGIPREELEAVLGVAVHDAAPGAARGDAPGSLPSHYAPRARLRLDATAVGADEGLLAFGPPLAGAERAAAVVQLSADGDLREAATRLYAALRELDAAGVATIAVMPIPREGLGAAIADRLARAAAPRPGEG